MSAAVAVSLVGRRRQEVCRNQRIVVAATTQEGKPDQITLRSIKKIQPPCKPQSRQHSATPRDNAVCDGRACLWVVTDTGCAQTTIKSGSGPQAAKTPAFKWFNTARGDINAALA
jgi:hypothetical protein